MWASSSMKYQQDMSKVVLSIRESNGWKKFCCDMKQFWVISWFTSIAHVHLSNSSGEWLISNNENPFRNDITLWIVNYVMSVLLEPLQTLTNPTMNFSTWIISDFGAQRVERKWETFLVVSSSLAANSWIIGELISMLFSGFHGIARHPLIFMLLRAESWLGEKYLWGVLER